VMSVDALDLVNLLPRSGVIAISGGRLEEDLVKAVMYARNSGADLRLIPLSPKQMQWALEMDIPVVRGYPTYFIRQAEYKGPDYFLQSRSDSVFADRIMAKMAEHLWAFVTDQRKEVLVEAVPQFIEYTLDELSLYGDILDRTRNYMGHVLIRLRPAEDDFFHLAHALRDVPGVIDVGIYLETPEKTVVIKK
jgi:hypothetical protein